MLNNIKDHIDRWLIEYVSGSIIILVIALILGLGMLKCRATGIDHWETYSPCFGCRNQIMAVCKKE